jgi:O-antigen/teichoic acid export membrane protein
MEKKRLKALLIQVPVLAGILILISGGGRVAVGYIFAAFGVIVLLFVKPIAVYMRKRYDRSWPNPPPMKKFTQGMIHFGVNLLASGILVILVGLLLR